MENCSTGCGSQNQEEAQISVSQPPVDLATASPIFYYWNRAVIFSGSASLFAL
jgi:hypothetical protein